MQQTSLKAPRTVHAFAGQDFGSQVFVAPTGDHRCNALVVLALCFNRPHGIKACVEVEVAQVAVRRPHHVVRDHRNLRKFHHGLSRGPASGHRTGDTKRFFPLGIDGVQVGRGVNGPGTIGQHTKRDADFLRRHSSIHRAVAKTNRV